MPETQTAPDRPLPAGPEPRHAPTMRPAAGARETLWHELVVVGNGFDLECGLRTRFRDFFRSRFATIDAIDTFTEDVWCAAVREADLTIWDFILKWQDDRDWCDVEGTIAKWVVQPEGSESIERASKTAQRVRDYPFAAEGQTTSHGRPKGEKAIESFVIGNTARFCWMKVGAKRARTFEQKDIFPLLLTELTRLEQAFARYLSDEVASSEDYLERASDLFRRIQADARSTAGAARVQTSVLTFNYTRPFTEPLTGLGLSEQDVINIHGRLDGDVIFGIDGKDCMDDLYALPFTKTYRVVVAGTHMPITLMYGATRGREKPSAYTAVIKFYGHSLGEPDYSYFQSIFDGVDLYGGRTSLVFYYRPWDQDGRKVSPTHARTTMVKSVAKLLNTYGSTLDNKEHGKNLMHKLLLEGRLEVKSI